MSAVPPISAPQTPQAAEPVAPTSVLEVRNLQKGYQGRMVVRDFSLTVQSGQIAGLLGPNGAGKTTCFYMIVGLVPADGGQILLNGQDITRSPIHVRARRGLSYLPQEASIFKRLSVADNIRAVLELQKDDQGRPLSEAEIGRQLNNLLQELQIVSKIGRAHV